MNLWQWLVYRLKPVTVHVDLGDGDFYVLKGCTQYTADRVGPKIQQVCRALQWDSREQDDHE